MYTSRYKNGVKLNLHMTVVFLLGFLHKLRNVNTIFFMFFGDEVSDVYSVGTVSFHMIYRPWMTILLFLIIHISYF